MVQRCGIYKLESGYSEEVSVVQDRALLVDDEPNILLTLGLVLKSEGFNVQTAESAQAAKTFLCGTKFDLVVTDLSLEQPLSGFEVVRVAKLQPIKPATVVISGFQDLLTAWKENGADAGLTKPTDVQELLSTIDRLLPHRKSGNGNGRDAA
jgi:DNA-binding response OmpR family regulator